MVALTTMAGCCVIFIEPAVASQLLASFINTEYVPAARPIVS